ncbi:MAG: sortase [Lachnospiraceae bacterium]
MNGKATPAPLAVPSAASEAALPTVIPSETDTTQILPAPSAPVAVLEDIEGYSTTAQLRIDTISLDLFIIGEVSEAALKVSPCLYAGPSSPEYPGNIVITGHNNRNKTHFGRLDELKSGSAVLLSDKYGTEYYYEVYGMETIGPNEVDALEEYEGEYGLTLVTCADQGKNRLLVRCRRVE